MNRSPATALERALEAIKALKPSATVTIPATALMEVARALAPARDWIGGMPTIDADGEDRFLAAARIVHQLETAQAALKAAGIETEGK